MIILWVAILGNEFLILAFMQTSDNEHRLFLVQVHSFASVSEWRIEPLFKVCTGVEDTGQKKVQQSPQLRQLVLEGSTSQEHPVWCNVVGVQSLGQLAVVVLHSVALVNHQTLPADFGQR